GRRWEEISSALSKAGADLPAIKIAVAPDNEGIVATVTDSGSAVYISLDGGMSWDDANVPTLTGNIQTIAISAKYTEDGRSYREIAVGTAEWGDDSTTGQLWVLQGSSMWASWENQGLAIDPLHIGAEISAIAYSPDYQHDRTLIVVASTAGDVAAPYQERTWLCLGERDTEDGGTSWDSFDDYPLEIATAGDGAGIVPINSSLALPSDYSSEDESSRRLFISYDREPDAGDDIYLIDEDTTHRLDANGGADINIASISYHGTTNSGMLLAGDAGPVTATFTVQVRRTEEPFDQYPKWYTASVPPTGPGNAMVSWNPDGTIAYCGTSQSPGKALDESAVSASLDGDKWRQMGLMDTAFQLADIAVTPDSEFLFVTSSSTFGPEGVWRSFSDPLGESWERVLTMDTDTNAVIVRLSAGYSDDSTIYVAEAGGNLMAVSYNRGNTWQWCRAPGPVIDMVVSDEETVYIALADGYISKTTDGGWRWDDPVETTLTDINMLAVVDDNTILVGGRNGDVAYSADGGESFIGIREVLGSGEGDVQVVADADFSENGIIYAATNRPDEGLWRWTIGVSDEWEQLDEDITELEQGQCISGLAVGPEGTLYALRLEPTST
ncbi:MAG: PQQ-like beta-propeller repeat protein, partial [Dehalococcoidia bacterium]|nr:PQQ-like beta-propeller repeat protein [Dehalococcoidia bacterium]